MDPRARRRLNRGRNSNKNSHLLLERDVEPVVDLDELLARLVHDQLPRPGHVDVLARLQCLNLKAERYESERVRVKVSERVRVKECE